MLILYFQPITFETKSHEERGQENTKMAQTSPQPKKNNSNTSEVAEKPPSPKRQVVVVNKQVRNGYLDKDNIVLAGFFRFLNTSVQ